MEELKLFEGPAFMVFFGSLARMTGERDGVVYGTLVTANKKVGHYVGEKVRGKRDQFDTVDESAKRLNQPLINPSEFLDRVSAEIERRRGGK